MTVKDCVKTMLSKRGWSQRKLAEELGYSGQGSMGMTVETLIKWADAMEFQIIIQSENEEMILDGESEG